MAERREDVLDVCLEHLFKGDSIEDCLKSYPEQTLELEPLLKTSSEIIHKASAIQPDPRVKARVRAQFEARLRERRVAAIKVPLWRRRWATAAATVAIVFITGIGVAAASTAALPGETLYSVKLATEQARLALTLSDMGKAELHIHLAERRIGEVAEMARRGESDKILVLTEQVANHLDEVYGAEETRDIEQKGPKIFVPPSSVPSEGAEDYSAGGGCGEELTIMLNESRARSLEILESAWEEAPQEAKPGLQQATTNIRADYDETLSKIKGGPD